MTMSDLPLKFRVTYFFFQRLLRINSHVPWTVHFTSIVSHPDKIKAKGHSCPGDSPGCYIQAANGIEIGDNVWIGPGVKIISANHDLCNFERHVKVKPIIIGNNCWLGANCVILPGVKLEEHTIVGAGAVVTKSFGQGDCVLVGVPAKIAKKIGPYGNYPEGNITIKPSGSTP